MKHTRWCHSMAGTEYARVYSWGADPDRKVFRSHLQDVCLVSTNDD